jgi:signal transduction histidine kinase
VATAWRPRLRSFKAKLLLLVAVAVSVPALLTCTILGLQLDTQARALFAKGLTANLETFSLILQDSERNLFDGVKRAAADNTLQITLDLGMKSQLQQYVEAQLPVLGIAFIGVYDKNFRAIALTRGEADLGQWRLESAKDAAGTPCVAAPNADQQLVTCNDIVYLVSVVSVFKAQEGNLGDGAARSQGLKLLGYLIGGTPLASPDLITSLRKRQIVHPLIWVGDRLVYANIPAKDLLRPANTERSAREYVVDGVAYLGVATTTNIGTRTLAYAVMAPLAPLQTTLLESLMTVAAIGLLLVIATLIIVGFIAKRLLRPVQQLQEGAVQIGAGMLDHRIVVTTGDELQVLADQFNQMAGQLHTSYAGLEQKVEERTRELRTARDSAEAALDQLRTAQDRLIQSEKLASLGQLTAGIAHEIKNPLNFVNNFAELSGELTGELREALAPGKTTLDAATRNEVDALTGLLTDNLAKITQHGRRADSIVKNMLLHSREGGGERRVANLNAIVEESLNLAYHGARAEKPGFNITLEKDLDPAMGEIELYPQEITRVLLNLISNGFYAAQRRKLDGGTAGFEPTLRIATRSLGDKVEIRVRDNGTGIPDEVKAQMFNPFFTTKPASEGTGLGLSMSFDIVVKQHGGTIVVDTKAGEFSEFTITMPRRLAAISVPAAAGAR